MVLSGRRLERARSSKQFEDGHFRNTGGVSLPKQSPSLSVMGEFFFGGKERTPRAPLPIESPLAAWAKPFSASRLRVTWRRALKKPPRAKARLVFGPASDGP